MDLAFINKKRLPQFFQLNKINEKVARTYNKIANGKTENFEKSKIMLDEANNILSKNNLKIDALSTEGMKKLYIIINIRI